MRPLIIYHSQSVSGFGAALVAWLAFNARIEVFSALYNQNPPNVEGRDVYILDFWYPPEILRAMAQEATSITVMGRAHSQKSALRSLLDAGVIRGDLDSERVGAMIAWDAFFPGDEPPDLIRYIQDRELLQFSMADTNQVYYALWSYPRVFKLWDQFMQEDGLEVLRNEGHSIWRYHQAAVQKIAEQSFVGEFAGYRVPVVSAPLMYASDVGYMLAPGQHFAMTFFDGVSGRSFSLRSTAEGLDVGELAERFGGGGNPRAAGFRIHLNRDLLTA